MMNVNLHSPNVCKVDSAGDDNHWITLKGPDFEEINLFFASREELEAFAGQLGAAVFDPAHTYALPIEQPDDESRYVLAPATEEEWRLEHE